MEFLYFYDKALLNRENLKIYESGTGSYSATGSPLALTGVEDNTTYTALMTFKTEGASPEGVLMSDYSNGSGYALGVNKANRLYIHTPDTAYTFGEPLQEKNTIALSKANGVFSIYLFNHYTSRAYSEVYRMNTKYENQTGALYLGGNTEYTGVYGGSGFSGYIDQFALTDHALYEDVIDQLFSGFEGYTITGTDYEVSGDAEKVTYSELTATPPQALIELNSGIYTQVIEDLNAAYTGTTYASGTFTGNSSSTYQITGDFNYKTALESGYQAGISIYNTGTLSASFTSNYSYVINYNHDGAENATITLAGTFSGTSLQPDPFYIYTNVSQKWHYTTGLSYDSSFKNDYRMMGANIFNTDYKNYPFYLYVWPKRDDKVNQIPKYKLLTDKYVIPSDFQNSGLYVDVNRVRYTQTFLDSREIDSTTYTDLVRYHDKEYFDNTNPGFSSFPGSPDNSNYTDQGLFSGQSMAPHASYIVRSTSGGFSEDYLVDQIDYVETSAADLLYLRETIRPDGDLSQVITID